MTEQRLLIVIGSEDDPLIDAPFTVGTFVSLFVKLINWLFRTQIVASLILLWAAEQAAGALTAISGMAVMAEAETAEMLTLQAQTALTAVRLGAIAIVAGFVASIVNRIVEGD